MKVLRDLVDAILGTDTIWLQCQEKFHRVALFNSRRGRLRRFSRICLGFLIPSHTDGHYSDHSNGTLILYRLGGKIVFRILAPGVDEQFQLDDNTKIEVTGPPTRRELTVVRNGVQVFKTTYSVREVYRPPDDPTPFVDDEDFDFGLWASNISKSPERKKVFLGIEE